MASVRPPAVAGLFYPAEESRLRAEVRGYLRHGATAVDVRPKALVAPHAGYVYSGPIAGSAYRLLQPLRDVIERVVLLGPCHRVAVHGLALPGSDTFETPMGEVRVDRDACERILSLPQVQVFDATHRQEHGLEVHLPFLQSVLRRFTLVPLVVGEARAEDVAEVLEMLWDGPETLIVVSSDLSHYSDYDTAKVLDSATCRAVESLDPDAIGPHDACGFAPLRGLLQLARQRGMSVHTLDLRSSGDTAGDRDQVVGYGAWAFCEA